MAPRKATSKVTASQPAPQLPAGELPTINPGPVELTPKQVNDWDQTRAMLLWHNPAFAHIFITMMSAGKNMAVFSRDVPIAATDGSSLILNPDTYFNYTLPERVFINCHEIMHSILDHCGHMHLWQKSGEVGYPDGTKLPYAHELMNQAMDYVINDMLIEANVGTYNKDWLHRPDIATRNDSVVDAYAKVYEDFKQNGGKLVTQVSFDQLLQPGSSKGQDPSQAQSQRNPQEWKAQVAAAAASAKAQGKLPAGLERLFGEILEPKVDWREHIVSLLARRLGSGRRDWTRPDKRLIVRDIYAPGRSGFGTGTVVVGVDTSGSVGPKELDMFLAEVSGILEDVKPKELYLIWCDAEVNRVDQCDDASDLNTIRCKGAVGGGGTDFRPVFDKIDELGLAPEALVYLTDGMGSFPEKAPSYPVVWGSIYEASKYPFGDVVQVPKQA